MPQHKSAAKRVRQSERKRVANRLHRSRMRTIVKKLQNTTERDEALVLLKDVKVYLDRMVNKGIIHKNKAANAKSKLEKSVNALA